MKKFCSSKFMSGAMKIASAVFGILLLAALVGYSGGEDIPNVPKPDAELCGVTKEAYDTVPGSGALLDIGVDITWDDSTVWIGIITVEDYESLEKLGGNSDGEIVSCDARIDYVAGGPSTGETSSFSYTPDGEDFHIMIGSLEEANDDDDDDGGDPWPFDSGLKSQSFVDEFNVKVDFDVSGGWGILLILFVVEVILGYLILAGKSS